MEPFEYIAAIYSVVIALGVANLLAALGDTLKFPYFQFVVLYYLATWLLKPSSFTPEFDLRHYFYSIRTPLLLCLLTPSVVLAPWIVVRFDLPIIEGAMITTFAQ